MFQPQLDGAIYILNGPRGTICMNKQQLNYFQTKHAKAKLSCVS